MKLLNKITQHLVLCYGVLILTAVIVYGRTIFFNIVYFDDQLWVKDFHAYLMRGVNGWEFFAKPDLITEFYYRPLLNLSFAIDTKLGTGSAINYHVTNVVIHVANVCLMFAIFQAWGMSRLKSLAGALIFAVHPALVQSIAWIPGRTDSLLGFFCFTGLLFYLRFHRTQKIRDLIGCFVGLIGALLTKETGIVLGFMIVLFEIFSFVKRTSSRISLIRVLSAVVMIVIVWWVIRAKVIAGAQMFGQEQMIKSFIENLPSMLLYLGKIFLPVNLSVFPLRADANLMWGWVSIGCLAAGAVSSWKQLSFKIVCAGLWMIVFILPCLVLSDLDYEYRLYVPILGALIVVLELWPKKIRQRLSVAISIFVVSLFMVMSWRYAGAFQDQWTFWPRAAAEALHSPLAQRNLGAMHHLKGDLDQAEVYYKKSLAINPKEKMVNNNLGLIYQSRGDRARAIEFYNQEIQNHPDYDLGYYNLSSILMEQKNWDDAVVLLKKSIELNPLGVDAYARLIRIYLVRGKFDEARVVVQRLKSTGARIPDDILQNARKLNVDLTSP